jgi:signal transduction histidine kinase
MDKTLKEDLTQMVGMISHDLRQSLSTILACTELLTESNLDEEQRELYQQIHLSVNHMADLLTSLQEFSRTPESLQLVYGDVVDALRDTINSVRVRPEFRQIQLTFHYEGPTNGWFDFKKLDRVFQNLLRNACEAVSPATGKVRVEALGLNGHIEISVSDNGAGIPEQIRDEIFKPFVTYGKGEGTGLGLAIVQKIVRDHGGEVKLESGGPDGTTFNVTLPVAPRPVTSTVSCSP